MPYDKGVTLTWSNIHQFVFSPEIVSRSRTRKYLERVNDKRLSFDGIDLDHSQLVAVNGEDEAGVAGDGHHAEPVADVAI